MKNLVLILSLLFAVNISNAQWAVLNSGTTSSLTGLYFTSPDTGHVVSATFPNSGQLFSTTNGTTWSQQQSLPDYLFTSFFINKNMGWVAGGNIWCRSYHANPRWRPNLDDSNKYLRTDNVNLLCERNYRLGRGK